MRTRLLPLLIVLLAAVLLALGVPLAISVAAAQQQKVIVDRIDDTARFAALAQFVTDVPTGSRPADTVPDERQQTLDRELASYYEVYGIRAGVFYRTDTSMANAPDDFLVPKTGEVRDAFAEALLSRRSHDPEQVWPWQHDRLVVASPVIRDGDVIAVVVTDSPTGPMRSRTLRGWLTIGAGEIAAMLLAVGAALRLTGWVLRPVRVLDATTHDIATGRLKSRVAAAGGPPELQRLARSFNEMADNVEDVLEQQRAFVADASHQLRNPLSGAPPAAHRTARTRAPGGQRRDRLGPHRGQASDPGLGRPARPGPGGARGRRPQDHRHRRADRPSASRPGHRPRRPRACGWWAVARPPRPGPTRSPCPAPWTR